VFGPRCHVLPIAVGFPDRFFEFRFPDWLFFDVGLFIPICVGFSTFVGFDLNFSPLVVLDTPTDF